MWKWKIQNTTGFFFFVITLQFEQSSILTCWIPSKTPGNINRNNNSDLFVFSQPKSQPCSKISLKHKAIWGPFLDTDRNPANLEHTVKTELLNLQTGLRQSYISWFESVSRLWSDIRRRHLKYNANPLTVKSIYLPASDATSKFLNTNWTTDVFSLNKTVGEGSRVALLGGRRSQQQWVLRACQASCLLYGAKELRVLKTHPHNPCESMVFWSLVKAESLWLSCRST